MFDNIIGNDKIKKMLSNTVKAKKTSHSYLFIGPDGIGKKMIAKEFSKMLLCLDENKYCSKCKSCIEFDSSNNPDFVIIEPEGTEIKIDQIRQMQEDVYEKPIISTNKVYIIDNADKMNTKAQNCLLKTLEEPPEFVTIILIGNNENAFLNTIKSRCTIINFDQISNSEMKKFLVTNYQIEVTESILEMFQGSILKAIELKDKREEYSKIDDIIENMQNLDLIDIVDKSEILYNSKEEIQKFLEYINILLMRKMKKDCRYANCIEIVEDTKIRLRQNCNYDMCIDNMIWNIWRELN